MFHAATGLMDIGLCNDHIFFLRGDCLFCLSHKSVGCKSVSWKHFGQCTGMCNSSTAGIV